MYKLQIEQKVNLLILTNYSFTIYTLIIFQRIQFVNLSLAQSGLFVLTTNWIKYTNKHKQSPVWRGLEDKEERYHFKKFYVTSSPSYHQPGQQTQTTQTGYNNITQSLCLSNNRTQHSVCQ